MMAVLSDLAVNNFSSVLHTSNVSIVASFKDVEHRKSEV